MSIRKIGLTFLARLSHQPVVAKTAKAFFFSCEATKGFTVEDNCISISYSFNTIGYTNFWGYWPYPNLKIEMKNKTEKTIYVDLEKSFMKRGDEKRVIYDSTFASTPFTTIAPYSSVILGNHLLFTGKSKLFYTNGIYCFQEKKGWCIMFDNRKVEEGKTIEFNETDSPFKFHVDVAYTLDKEAASDSNLCNEIYVNRIAGIKISKLTSRIKLDYLNKLIPNWGKMNSFWLRAYFPEKKK